MLISRGSKYRHHRGTSLVEVLVTLLILAFGLLGVAGLQSKVGQVEMESYQRAQAILALSEITERINANRSQAASYVTTGSLGTQDAQPADCTTVAAGPPRDLCEWSNSLKGAGEQLTPGNAATNVGGTVGARGCITQMQAPNPALGVCLPGIYQVSVAWQGMSPTVAPAQALACGQGAYGDEKLRRLISAQIVIAPQMADGTTSCY
jgi:type IV pilus assembly protein PilV